MKKPMTVKDFVEKEKRHQKKRDQGLASWSNEKIKELRKQIGELGYATRVLSRKKSDWTDGLVIIFLNCLIGFDQTFEQAVEQAGREIGMDQHRASR